MQNKKDELAELRELLYRYLSYWKWFVVSIVSFLAIAFVYIKIKAPVYQVNSNILVKEDDKGGAAKGASLMRSMGVGFPGSMDVQDELYSLSSFSLMRQVVDTLGLYTEYKEKAFPINEDLYGISPFTINVSKQQLDTLSRTLKFKVDIDSEGVVDVVVSDKKGYKLKLKDQHFPVLIDTKYGPFTLEKTPFFKEGYSADYIATVSNPDEVTEEYLKVVDIFLADKKANVLSLVMESTNVKKAKEILNTLVTLYNQDASVEKNALTQNTAEFIKNRLAILSVELADAENEVESFKKRNKLFDLGLESKALLDQSGDIKTKLVEVTSELTVLEEIENTLVNRADKYELLPVSLGIQNESLAKGIMEYNQLLLEHQRLQNSSYPGNPIVKNLETNILALRQNILGSIQNVKEGLRIGQKDLNKQMDQFYGRFADAPTIEKEFINIKRNQAIKEGLVVFLMEKREENALSAALTSPKARVIDTAYKNNKPVAPRKLVILAISLALGLIVPVVVIYLRDILVRTFNSKEEVEKVSNVPVIGEVCSVDDSEKSEGSILIKKDSVSPVAELFRLIRTNLQFVLTKKEDKVILVTSTQGGEGKSFVSSNLAASLALTGKKVVLVGLDIRKPMLAQYLAIHNKEGVTNYLANEDVTIDELLHRNLGVQNLDVIVAGPIPPNPGELLLGDRMKQFFEELKARYDYVIVDSAPVGMVSDTFSLVPYSDMTLYVIRANYSDKSSLNFIEGLQNGQRLKKLYLVVNGTKIKNRNGYGYGYGYGVKTK